MKKILILSGLLVVAFLSYKGYAFYKAGFVPNVKVDGGSNPVLLVYPGQSLEGLKDTLKSRKLLQDTEAFDTWARYKGLKGKSKPGRYLLKDGQTNNSLVNMLKAGNQEPLNVTLYDISDSYVLAGKLGSYLMADSLSFLALFQNDTVLQKYGLEPRTLTSVFLPNTYEFYWTISPGAVLQRMKKEYDRFWTDERKAKAKALGLSPAEVVTLASIVEKETIKADEKPLVARLYLNRLEKGIKLESDPTVIYGINLDHPKRRITRVYFKDLKYPSPYNTYQHFGLPPGPIKIPAISSIEAVLNAPTHNYIFMVADPERPGYHSFAVNYRQHLVNANKYRRSLR